MPTRGAYGVPVLKCIKRLTGEGVEVHDTHGKARFVPEISGDSLTQG
jgi:hypothetical protein